jgi:arabinose operon protein AraL
MCDSPHQLLNLGVTGLVHHYAGYIFDLDGTLYLDDELIPGAAPCIAHLRAQGKQVLFLTNKAIATRQEYAAKLSRFGIPCTQHEVINSSYVMARYLATHSPQDRLYVIGEEPLMQELRAEGLALTTDPLQTDTVVLSWDRTFTYRKLDDALQAVRRGARTIATNPDRTCPAKGGGEVADAAGMIGAVEGVTGKPLDLNVGKPSRITLEIALERLGLGPEQCLMVGDRIETDIRMGVEADMATALVLTGVTKEDDLAGYSYQPTYVLPSVRSLIG